MRPKQCFLDTPTFDQPILKQFIFGAEFTFVPQCKRNFPQRDQEIRSICNVPVINPLRCSAVTRKAGYLHSVVHGGDSVYTAFANRVGADPDVLLQLVHVGELG